MAKIIPLGNRVLVERTAAQTTKGGILLPDNAQEKPKEGTVIAVGPGSLNDEGKIIPMHVKVGDRVLFSKYTGTDVKTDDDKDLLILPEDDILGILN